MILLLNLFCLGWFSSCEWYGWSFVVRLINRETFVFIWLFFNFQAISFVLLKPDILKVLALSVFRFLIFRVIPSIVFCVWSDSFLECKQLECVVTKVMNSVQVFGEDWWGLFSFDCFLTLTYHVALCFQNGYFYIFSELVLLSCKIQSLE